MILPNIVDCSVKFFVSHSATTLQLSSFSLFLVSSLCLVKFEKKGWKEDSCMTIWLTVFLCPSLATTIFLFYHPEWLFCEVAPGSTRQGTEKSTDKGTSYSAALN